MASDDTELEERRSHIFAAMQAGNQDALVELVEIERDQLYDYLLRMTGHRDESLGVLDEVVSALKPQVDSFSTHQEFRVVLFATARSFTGHLWNADTKSLVNETFSQAEGNAEPRGLSELKQLEKQLSALPGWEREPIMLVLRYDFQWQDTAEIMSIVEKTAIDGYNRGLITLARRFRSDPQALEENITKIPNHPLSLHSQKSTMALSQIMEDMKTTRSRPGEWRRWVWWLFLLAAAAAAYAYFINGYRPDFL